MAAGVSLRVRKKQRTRAEIIRVARELFTERGYDATTIADIAAGADIATSTVFGYFATKDEILFAHHPAIVDDERVWLAERTGTKPAVALIRDYLIERLPETMVLTPEWSRTFRRMVDADPYLRAQEQLRLLEYQQVFAEAIARDIGGSPGDFRTQMVAAAALGAYNAGRRANIVGSLDADQVYDDGLKFLLAGCNALCESADDEAL